MRYRLLILGMLLILGLSTNSFAQKSKQLTNDDFVAPPPPSPAAATKAAEEDKLKNLVISLDRLGCYGPCPIYKLTIYGNGKVVYKGEKNVKVVGERVTTLEKEKVAALLAEFEKINYFELSDNYQGGPTDGTSAVTSIALGNKKKTIKNYHPAPDSPRALKELENQIDSITNSTQWIQ